MRAREVCRVLNNVTLGERHGRLVVIAEPVANENFVRSVRCRCDCGKGLVEQRYVVKRNKAERPNL